MKLAYPRRSAWSPWVKPADRPHLIRNRKALFELPARLDELVDPFCPNFSLVPFNTFGGFKVSIQTFISSGVGSVDLQALLLKILPPGGLTPNGEPFKCNHTLHGRVFDQIFLFWSQLVPKNLARPNVRSADVEICLIDYLTTSSSLIMRTKGSAVTHPSTIPCCSDV